MSYQQHTEELFKTARTRILKNVTSKDVDKIESEITHIVEALDGRRENAGALKNFTEWSVPELLSAQGRLALLRVNLGSLASVETAKVNHIRIYKMYQVSKKWNPIKVKLEKEFNRLGQKMYKDDIENTLVEAFYETTQKDVFQQEIADRLNSLFNSTNQVLTSIKMQIAHKQSEERETKYYDQLNQVPKES